MCNFQQNQWKEQELCAIFNKINEKSKSYVQFSTKSMKRARNMCKFQQDQWKSKSDVQIST